MKYSTELKVKRK